MSCFTLKNVFIFTNFNYFQPHVELCLTTNNETIIRAVLVFAEGIFAGETHVVHPRDEELTSSLKVALFPPRDVPLDIHIKVIIIKAYLHLLLKEETRLYLFKFPGPGGFTSN